MDLVGAFPKVSGGRFENLALKCEMTGENKSRIIGHIEPFVPIGRNRVSGLQTAQQMRVGRIAGREETERAIDMQPCPIPGAEFSQRCQVIKRTGVYFPRAGDHESGRAMESSKTLCKSQGIDLDPTWHTWEQFYALTPHAQHRP